MAFGFFNKKEKDQVGDQPATQTNQGNATKNDENDVLRHQYILIDQKSVDKDTAIEMAGQLLVDGGYVMPEYIKAMKDREKMLTTYIGNGIAIPHGVGAAKEKIIKSGVSIIQFPEGVDFGEDKKAYLVIGIAGKGNEHMKILTNLAEFIQDESVVKELCITKDKEKIYKSFTSSL